MDIILHFLIFYFIAYACSAVPFPDVTCTLEFKVMTGRYFDLSAYMSYNDGTMTDYIPTDEDLERGFATIPPQPEL